ncbi:MAG: hypothetical protein ACRBBP_08425 [Bdellovibrionales bacterium]
MGIRTLGVILLGVWGTTGQALGGTSQLSLEDKISIAKTRCAPPASDEPYFFMDMFKQNTSMEEIDKLYIKVYNQEERLFNRAGFNQKSQTFVTKNDSASVTLPEHYIKSLILHVEKSLRLNYVKYIFFPDMGHSHLLTPEDYHEEHISNKDWGHQPGPLNGILQAPGLKSLYHTAEHLKFKDGDSLITDWYVQWRFYTRNPVIDADGNIELMTNEGARANAVSSVEGYHWNAGISVSAHKNGCIPFEDSSGQIQYFDVSAWDPPYDCVNNFCGKTKVPYFKR